MLVLQSYWIALGLGTMERTKSSNERLFESFKSLVTVISDLKDSNKR